MSPDLVALVMGVTAWAVSAEVLRAWKFCRTTSVVSGDPSWNCTFGRRLTVHAVMSVLGTTDNARWGRMDPSAATDVNVSNTALA